MVSSSLLPSSMCPLKCATILSESVIEGSWSVSSKEVSQHDCCCSGKGLVAGWWQEDYVNALLVSPVLAINRPPRNRFGVSQLIKVSPGSHISTKVAPRSSLPP